MAAHETTPRLPLSRRDFVRTTGLGMAALASGAAARGEPLFAGRWPQGGLLVRGGTIVTAEQSFRADVRVRGDKIVEVGPGLAPAGERVIDADALLVLPGAMDPHTHLTQAEGAPEKYRLSDDFTSGSEAALAGGITVIGNMTVPGEGQTVFEALERDARFVSEKAIADIVLHPVLLDPSELAEQGVRQLAEAGRTTIKIFMVIPSFDQHLRDYVRVMRMAGQAGILSLIHCEDPAIIAEATHALVAAGKGSLRYYAGSRPLSSEVIATQRAIGPSTSTTRRTATRERTARSMSGSRRYAARRMSRRSGRACRMDPYTPLAPTTWVGASRRRWIRRSPSRTCAPASRTCRRCSPCSTRRVS